MLLGSLKSPRLRARSLRKHPFLLALHRWGRFARNVPSGEERGEKDVFEGYRARSTKLNWKNDIGSLSRRRF